MKAGFYELAESLISELSGEEVLLCSVSAEESDFVRFNQARVRQAGSVVQQYLTIRLIHDARHATVNLALSGGTEDLPSCRDALRKLRDTVAQLPADPWLLYAQTPHSTASERRGRLPAAEEVVGLVARSAANVDLVGFYAAGTLYRGFASSLGQRNWHEVDTYNFDWSLHLPGNKAVKGSYAGFDWDVAAFEAKLDECAQQLALMRSAPISLSPGEYRAYLAPQALEEITGLMQWGAFSARDRVTRQSPLLRMEHGEALSAKVTLVEKTSGAVTAPFQEDGYVKRALVPLITEGKLAESLVSPRSAREYALETNGANSREIPEALDMAPGGLDPRRVLEALDTGLFVGNLWYLNYSDRPAARITGMTRFATFWVEHGRIVAPVAPLRFDDTLYRMLGANLADLTATRDLLLSTSTYDERSTSSSHLPGALLESLRFTL